MRFTGASICFDPTKSSTEVQSKGKKKRQKRPIFLGKWQLQKVYQNIGLSIWVGEKESQKLITLQ